jgi:hypothetical protein
VEVVVWSQAFSAVKTNFHIIPLLLKAHHPNRKSMYWQIFQAIEWDIRSRALKLSRLGYVLRVPLPFPLRRELSP